MTPPLSLHMVILKYGFVNCHNHSNHALCAPHGPVHQPAGLFGTLCASLKYLFKYVLMDVSWSVPSLCIWSKNISLFQDCHFSSPFHSPLLPTMWTPCVPRLTSHTPSSVSHGCSSAWNSHPQISTCLNAYSLSSNIIIPHLSVYCL